MKKYILKYITPFLTVYIISLGIAAQTPEPSPQPALAQVKPTEITRQDVVDFIEKAKTEGKTFPENEATYVLKNFDRRELNDRIDGWQVREGLRLVKAAKIRIIVDYLLSELASMNALGTLLETLGKGESANLGTVLKTQVSNNTGPLYSLGKIRVLSNLTDFKLNITGQVIEHANSGEAFTVEAGNHYVIVTKGANPPCAKPATVSGGGVSEVECNF